MLKRLRGSLTARIFGVTFLFTTLACLITYAAVAGLTPISYAYLLEDELDQKAEELISQLVLGTSEDSQELLMEFSEQTGTNVRLSHMDIIQYDIVASEGDAPEGYYFGTGSLEQMETSEADSIWYYSNSNDPYQSESIVAESPYSNVYERKFAISFSDGQQAMLEIKRVHASVIQAAEAIHQLLPFMLVAALLLSLLGAVLYSRMITRPVVSLSRIAGRMASQDFSVRWQGRRTDEIGELGSSLNLLSSNLSDALNQLTEANTALQRDIDREREFERQRSSFFAAASHELKTPVTILKGQLSGMLAQVGVYKDRDKYLTRTLQVTSRMERLIQDILTISRLRADDFALIKTGVDISRMLRELIDEHEELISGKGMKLETAISENIIIQGNAQLLRNAIGNVLMNAILYSPKGVAIRIRLNNERLEIENTNTVIDQNELAHLAEPFYRVESSHNRSTGGSGLGLYIVDCIMKQHAIPYQIYNSEDGVCFAAYFRIPGTE